MRKANRFTCFLAIIFVLLAACNAKPEQEIEATADETAETTVTPVSETGNSEESTSPTPQSYAGRVEAPEFPTDVDWLNTGRPLTLAELKGKVVLLDFWTYGCINCIHIIPDLKRLEHEFADELVVIGVHSAKFANEGETENIRRIILRYELTHPVINDNNFEVWSQYGAQSWPTLVLIDPDGKVLGYHSGEDVYGPFQEVIDGMVKEFDALGKIDRTPLDLDLENESQLDSPLLFPGKVLADTDNNRLFISDSNHNRLVVTDLEGTVLDVIGDGAARLKDGSYEEASFSRPQGLTLADADTLYVADTENHAIRLVDLAARTVTTVAGTGQQVYMQNAFGNALETPLNSPWDVLYHDGMVYIAMAGQHQIWAYDPSANIVILHAGTGREELTSGPLLQGGLNQPSGLATDGEVLYFADSEASAIRTADFDPSGILHTIVGTGLFDFGDVDGTGDEVRLQHPLGVAYHDGLLYVADTYNSKIKVIDPDTESSNTFLGGSEAGWQDGKDALFDEPGGLSVGGNKLYIADTNNHVIRVADLDTKEVTTLVLVDLNGLLTRRPSDAEYNGKTLTLDPQTLADGQGTIELDVTLPDGYKVNDLAPFSMEWLTDNTAEEGLIQFSAEDANRTIVEPTFPLSFPATFTGGESEITADLVIYYCEAEAESLCYIERIRITAPVTISSDGSDTLVVPHAIEVPGT
ncbi:MAG: thioredoxin-like domain-containing protein [Candidatus Promineifilaceae bacterium]